MPNSWTQTRVLATFQKGAEGLGPELLRGWEEVRALVGVGGVAGDRPDPAEGGGVPEIEIDKITDAKCLQCPLPWRPLKLKICRPLMATYHPPTPYGPASLLCHRARPCTLPLTRPAGQASLSNHLANSWGQTPDISSRKPALIYSPLQGGCLSVFP